MVSISIVVPTYNRRDRLQRVISALEVQTYPIQDYELIVVSDGSQDGTEQLLNDLETPLRLIPVCQGNQGAAVARNTGWQRAAGDIILFLDDDVVPAPDLLAEHARFHSKYESDIVVMGPMLTPPGFKMSPWVRWEQEMLEKQYADMTAGRWEPTARQFYTGNTSLSRKHLEATHGFDPSFRRAEDVELAFRLNARGVKFIFNPDAVGWHYAERSYEAWLQIPYAYGKNDVTFAAHKGQIWLPSAVFKEYLSRHTLIRSVTELCLDRPHLSRIVQSVSKWVMNFADTLEAKNVSRYACSVIFNLRYYQGFSDTWGGRKLFFDGVHQASLELIEESHA